MTAHAYDHACARVEAVVRALETARRPRALLEARILHARCLAAAGRVADAKQVLIPVAADCAEYGLPRLVADGGEPVTGPADTLTDTQIDHLIPEVRRAATTLGTRVPVAG